MQFLPTSIDPKSGTVAVVGGGAEAAQVVRLLRAAGANVRWYSSEVDVAEEVLLASPPPGWLELSFAGFGDVVAVVSADDGPLDDAVAARARAGNVPVHVVDRPDISTLQAFTPSGRRPAWITGPIGACWKAARSKTGRGGETGAVP